MSRSRDDSREEGQGDRYDGQTDWAVNQPVLRLYDHIVDERQRLPNAERALEPDRAPERRLERAEELRAAGRLSRPTVPEQQMMSILATLGERYGKDYVREHKIEMDGRYITHVDIALPTARLAIEVYGGPHYKAALDRTGTRQEDDAWRIARIEEAGWSVLIVRDTELTQTRWAATLEKVRTFLDGGRKGTLPDRFNGKGQ